MTQKQIEQETITIRVSLAGKAVILSMRMLSMTEESQLRQRYSGLTDSTEKGTVADQEWLINRDALKEFAADGDLQVITTSAADQKPEPVPVAEYFSQRSAFKERVAEYAVRGFLSKLAPDVSFL